MSAGGVHHGAATLVWVLGGVPTFGVMAAFGVASSTLFGRTPRTTVVKQWREASASPAKAQVLEMLLGLYWLAAVHCGRRPRRLAADSALIVSFVALRRGVDRSPLPASS